MIKDIWQNIAVTNVQQAVAFYKAIGFSFNEPRSTGNDSACMLVGTKQFVVMLFKQSLIESFTQLPLPNLQLTAQCLHSIELESEAAVDAMAEKIVAAGGKLYAAPSNVQGFMYGCGFADPDGNRWNPIYIDWDKMKG